MIDTISSIEGDEEGYLTGADPLVIDKKPSNNHCRLSDMPRMSS